MSINAILNTGLQNLQGSINRTRIAGEQLNADSDTFANQLVAMRQGEIETKAAAQVVKTADQILGTLIDLRG